MIKEINGMSVARYISSCLLSCSNLKGEAYYKKEDEYTEIIEQCLENVKGE